VLAAIREVRPSRVYVAADGPRPGFADDETACRASRECVLGGIDWECDIRTQFQQVNLGVRSAVSQAITWFFQQEDRGIILEDDCLPDPSFFWFCEELLDKYELNPKVMQISGGCHLNNLGIEESYYFSKYPHIWGWATWKDRWSLYSDTCEDFESEFEGMLHLFGSDEERSYWRKTYRNYFAGKYQSWAYAWMFSVWREEGLSVYPSRNLVRNIGFEGDAVHTKGWKDYRRISQMKLESIEQIEHPDRVGPNVALDVREFNKFFERPPIYLHVLLVALSAASYFFRRVTRKLRRVEGT
jgi:hypothetical protein